jgi:hypothetical protein
MKCTNKAHTCGYRSWDGGCVSPSGCTIKPKGGEAMGSPMIFCHTVSDTNQEYFDQKVSEALNEEHRENYTYDITFLQDEHSFYAHIIFTEIIGD